MASSFEIRAAVVDDVATLLTLVRELAEYERLSQHVHATEESLRESMFGSRPYAEAIIACADGESVGMAVYFHTFSTFLGKPGLYLEDLYVREPHRRRGYGDALLRYVARIALERGCGRLEWAALDWNAPAVQFYTDLGAEPLDDWTTYRVTEDTLRQLAGAFDRA
ncbi:GNAT family N-acetyltransferase [Candidatus Poribacteria bacterium]|jgi:GNAT superfamily N-acetyltransferase|nr:GNAT family N-acetyltransferase [Candidatus Poribacteria bacterium]MBT5534502.1 GNAT family N-acetyltransferase [Candidatus Poribacteria bacterium]MBT7097155.1 GNAT family N-acetyltransferase [Candidatus Poribacteria bacterium]MBT7804011.1 GNAT family N-acetyltransferase [Candidatus Poribacteria bacterium]